jgi:hypothetical protein
VLASDIKPTKMAPHIYAVMRLYLRRRISIDEAVRILPPEDRRKFRCHPYWSVFPYWTLQSLSSVMHDFARITAGSDDPLAKLIDQRSPEA